MILSGWGRYPSIEAQVTAPRSQDALLDYVRKGGAIARGNGRAYGDSAISVKNTIHMKHFDRMLAFDSDTGQLVAEAGVLLADVLKVFLPRGWFPSVTPGTKYVTLGGMVAADVHGKNHHKDGSFGAYVDWIDVVTADGAVKRCSRMEKNELFEWTIGGMGLTGVILRAAIRLRPVNSAWIEQTTIVAENLSQAIEIFERSLDATYSVAWIDCLQTGKELGRSLVMLGDHAEANVVPPQYRGQPLKSRARRKLSIPSDFPSWALNRLSIRAFNGLYFWTEKRKPRQKIIDWDSYFYPLDAIQGWNKIYGRRGFLQFQCALPLNRAETGLTELLTATGKAGLAPFLAVLKRLGVQESRFSFPMEGYTLALDFPVNSKTLALIDELNRIALRHGGRFYLAKDSCMQRDVFAKSEHRADEYSRYRRAEGASAAFRSAQSERLGL